MAVSYALTMPSGYFTQDSRDEFNEPCLSLHHDQFGWQSDHPCYASAVYAAQGDAAEREALAAAESEEAQRFAEESYAAESKMLDSIYREIARKYDVDLAADHPRNNAVKLALRALDSISVPVSEDREAA